MIGEKYETRVGKKSSLKAYYMASRWLIKGVIQVTEGIINDQSIVWNGYRQWEEWENN